jgi:NADPH:quinone reductase-like Zn-dependent oxidoreductase
VIATASSDEKSQRAKQLGADIVVNHTLEGWRESVLEETGGVGVDVVCEHFGGRYLKDALETLAPGGRLVTIGYTTGAEVTVDLSQILSKQVSISTSYMGTAEELARGLRLVERGLVKPVVASTYSLEDAVSAHRLLDSREFFGKIVLVTR